MKTAWKWIIGIVLGLVVVALLVGVGFAFRTGDWGCDERDRGRSDRGERDFEMMPDGGMHRDFEMMPVGGFLGGLIQLGALTLIVLGIVWLVRSLRKPTAPAAPNAACGKCGKVVQDDWKNCPHCGRKL
jgi:hypothetical protein